MSTKEICLSCNGSGNIIKIGLMGQNPCNICNSSGFIHKDEEEPALDEIKKRGRKPKIQEENIEKDDEVETSLTVTLDSLLGELNKS